MIKRHTDRAYLAGLIDGEGHLSVRMCHQKGGRYTNHRCFLTIGMTDKEPLQWCKEITGVGSLYIQRRSEKDPTRKDIWYWTVCDHQLEFVLREVKPYLKIKLELLGYIMELRGLINRQKANRKRRRNPVKKLSLEELEKRDKVWMKVQAFNRRRRRRGRTKLRLGHKEKKLRTN